MRSIEDELAIADADVIAHLNCMSSIYLVPQIVAEYFSRNSTKMSFCRWLLLIITGTIFVSSEPKAISHDLKTMVCRVHCNDVSKGAVTRKKVFSLIRSGKTLVIKSGITIYIKLVVPLGYCMR